MEKLMLILVEKILAWWIQGLKTEDPDIDLLRKFINLLLVITSVLGSNPDFYKTLLGVLKSFYLYSGLL